LTALGDFRARKFKSGAGPWTMPGGDVAGFGRAVAVVLQHGKAQHAWGGTAQRIPPWAPPGASRALLS